ncbi:unnamed protein product, partial [Rotaria magnacalcarata]
MNDSCSTVETSSLSMIRENEKFSSTVIASPLFNGKVMTLDGEQEKNGKEQEENIPSSTHKHSSTRSNRDCEKMQSLQVTISTIVENLITQIDSNTNIPSNSSEERESIHEEKQDDFRITKRALRSRVQGKLNLSAPYQLSNDNRRVSNRRRAIEKNSSFDTYEKLPRKKTTSERSNDPTTELNHGGIFL